MNDGTLQDHDPGMDLQPGDDVGGYTIDGVLGQGGMGVVYSATHPVIGKRAAVKVLRAELSEDPSTVERFIREAKVVNQIRHPNIVDIFAIGTLETGQRYLVMDLLDGETLRSRLRRGALDLVDALSVLDECSSALIAAHDQGVVHRDLKPDNVFLVAVRGRPPEVKLLDFGVAKLMGSSTLSHPTQAGVAFGTPWYMSPEQARGARNVDHRTDIYALGVLAYEALTGVRPFDVLADGGKLADCAGGSPPDLVATVLRMIDDVADRRPTLDLVRAAVKRSRRELRSEAPVRPRVVDAPTTIDNNTDNIETPPDDLADGSTDARPPTHLPDELADDGKTNARPITKRARSPVFDGRIELGAAGALGAITPVPPGSVIELGAAGAAELDDGKTRARKPVPDDDELERGMTNARSLVLEEVTSTRTPGPAPTGELLTLVPEAPDLDDGETRARKPVPDPEPDDDELDHSETRANVPYPVRPPTAEVRPTAALPSPALPGPPRPESVIDMPRAESVEMEIVAALPPAAAFGGTLPLPATLVPPREAPAEPATAPSAPVFVPAPAGPTELVKAQSTGGPPWRLIAFLVTLAIGGALIFWLR